MNLIFGLMGWNVVRVTSRRVHTRKHHTCIFILNGSGSGGGGWSTPVGFWEGTWLTSFIEYTKIGDAS